MRANTHFDNFIVHSIENSNKVQHYTIYGKFDAICHVLNANNMHSISMIPMIMLKVSYNSVLLQPNQIVNDHHTQHTIFWHCDGVMNNFAWDCL